MPDCNYEGCNFEAEKDEEKCIFHLEEDRKDPQVFLKHFAYYLNAMRELRGEMNTGLDWPKQGIYQEREFIEKYRSKFTYPIGKEIYYFNGFVFPTTIDFTGCEFQRYVDFQNAVFLNGVNFAKAAFQRGVNFGNAKFQNEANFNEVNIQDVVIFTNTTFHEVATFANSKLRTVNPADFRKTLF